MQQRTARQLNTGREHNHNATLVPTLDISLFLTLTSSPSLFFILSFFCIAAIRLEQAGRPSWRDHSHQEPRAMWRLLVRWCRSICLLFPAHRGDKKAACWCHASTRCHHLPFKLTAWLCVAACCCWVFFLGQGIQRCGNSGGCLGHCWAQASGEQDVCSTGESSHKFSPPLLLLLLLLLLFLLLLVSLFLEHSVELTLLLLGYAWAGCV